MLVKILFTTILLFPFLFSCTGQTIDWLDTIVLEQFRGKTIVVKELDSIGKQCLAGRNSEYCSNSERLFDSRLSELRKQQREILNAYKMATKVTDKELDKLDRKKHQFFIDYDFDLLNISKERSSIHYLKFDFLVVDLTTNKIVGRARAENLKSPFDALSTLLDSIQEFQNEGY